MRTIWVCFVSAALPLLASFPPPPGKTGAPGDGRCTECHPTTTTNATRVIMDFTRFGYTPGVKQTIGVHVLTNAPASLRGFQVTARLASNEMVQAGRFSTNGPYSIATANGLQYISGPPASNINVFEWTPPATNVGPVKFYVVASNGEPNGTPDGNVVMASYTLPPSTRDIPAGYRMETFTVPGGNPNTYPADISSTGLITGPVISTATNRATSGFIRAQDGTITTFTIPGAAEVFPQGINNVGQIVGYYFPAAGGNEQPFLRSPDGTLTFPTFPGTDVVRLRDINDTGTVVGTFGNLAITFPFSAPQNFTFYDVAPGNATALGITASGRIIGTFNNSWYVRAVDGSVMGVSAREGRPDFLALNDSNQVVGSVFQGFIAAENGRFWPVNFTARSQNEAGVVVGNNSAGAMAILRSCDAGVNATQFTATAAGGVFTATQTGEPGCTPFRVQNESWISATENAGTFTIQVLANAAALERTGTIRIGNTTVTIRQGAAGCDPTFVLSASTFGSGGGSGVGTVTAPVGCSWAASTNAYWVSLSNATGTGSGTFQYTVGLNYGTQQRSGAISLDGQTRTLLQAGAPACSYAVSPSVLSLSAAGATGVVVVNTGEGCGVTNSSPVPWFTITGSHTAGRGAVSYNVAANPANAARSTVVSIAGTPVTVTQAGQAALESFRYVPVTPCRALDTRLASEGFFNSGETRNLVLPSRGCGVPASARAVAINLTAVPIGPLAFMTVFPSDQQRPLVSTLNSFNGRVVANFAIVPTSSTGAISLYAPGPTHTVVDVLGYFVPRTEAAGLQFFPVAPCRMADTRVGSGFTGASGAPRVTSADRSFPVLGGGCGIPATARAYALNITAVPPAGLAYLTVWPTGQARPLASTLNAFDGQVVPNAAVIPAGTNGEISLFASSETDVVIDGNGYFAPPGPGGLDFYPLAPCRVADTRNTQSTVPGGMELGVFPASCGTPPNAQGFSFNFTAVPQGYLAFVTTYPFGSTRPTVSTLNSWNGEVVANAALLPAGTLPAVNAYVANAADLIVDINGYFAPSP